MIKVVIHLFRQKGWRKHHSEGEKLSPVNLVPVKDDATCSDSPLRGKELYLYRIASTMTGIFGLAGIWHGPE